MICNMVHQEGVPDEWFKWNLFPYSLTGNAKTWYSFVPFEVEGNWNKLTKKFCKKFFPISKDQHLRRQVINFVQGEEEGIDQAWDRFNGLIEQGPRLGFSGDVLLHTFFLSLTPSCMQHVECVQVGISWRKQSQKPLNFYKKLVKRLPCEEIGKQDLRKSRNIIQERRSVLNFLKRQPWKSQKRNQSRKSLKRNTSSQELPRASTSPYQMRQTREACQARSH
jgi:hypothetical protein